MADIEVSQARTLSVSETTSDIEVTQLRVGVVYNIPTDNINISQLRVSSVVEPSTLIHVVQLRVLAVVRGRIENRKLRAWGCSIDGHNFYVLRLGEVETLVYDLTTGKWLTWGDENSAVWRAQNGMNWLDIPRQGFLSGAETQVVAGDHAYGIVWALVPDQGFDDHPVTENTARPFTRRVTGGLPMRNRNTKKVGAAYLTISNGYPQVDDAYITLRTSDDSGQTWVTHGTLTVTPDAYSEEFVWRSLGLIKSPGRIFEFTDNGATVRIDGLDIR